MIQTSSSWTSSSITHLHDTRPNPFLIRSAANAAPDQMATAMHMGWTPIAICSIILVIHLFQHRAEKDEYDLSNRTLLPVFVHRSIFSKDFEMYESHVWGPLWKAFGGSPCSNRPAFCLFHKWIRYPWIPQMIKHGRLPQRAMWLGPFQAWKGIAGQSNTVPCTVASNRGSEKPIIRPRQPTPTIKSNVVDRRQDIRLQKSTDKSTPCPLYIYWVRQLTLGLLFTHLNHWQ
jgi:hypothetical protein